MNIYFDVNHLDKNAVPGKGSLDSELAIVGTAPSTRRPAHQKIEALGSASWRLLYDVRDRAGISTPLPRIYTTNLVKTPMKSGTKVKASDLKLWGPRLDEELALIRPKRILALGGDAARWLCGDNFKNLNEDHGTFFHNSFLNATIVPTMNLQAIRYSTEYRNIIMTDLHRFLFLDPVYGPAPKPLDLFKMTTELPLGAEVVIDIETTGLEITDEILMIGFHVVGSEDFFIFDRPSRYDINVLGKLLHLKDATVIGHNLAFDMYMLIAHDIEPDRSHWPLLRTKDTMLLAHNRGKDSRLSLKHLTALYTNLPGPRGQGSTEEAGYLVEDLRSTAALAEHFSDQYDKFSGHLMCDMAAIFGGMRARGVFIDQKLLGEIYAVLANDVVNLKGSLDAVAPGVNWNSPAQVAEALMANGIKLTETTDSGAFSTAEPILLPLRDRYPLVSLLLDYKGMAKLMSGFVEPYLATQTNYVYPYLKIHGTATGRLSCENPNLQQIPRVGPFKSIFKSRWHDQGGKFALVDLSQAELRVAALLTNDEALCDALLLEDVHRYIASRCFNKPMDQVTPGERKASKAITFGLLYGGTPIGLSERAGLPVKRVKAILETFFVQFPDLKNWMDHIDLEVSFQGEVSSPMGRTRNLVSVSEQEGHKGAYRKGINTPIQGTASDIMLCIVRSVWRQIHALNLKSRPLFLVHDSMPSEVFPGEEEAFAKVVSNAFEELWLTPLANFPLFKKLPIVGDLIYGDSWAAVESTAEGYYNPSSTVECSSAGGREKYYVQRQ